MRIITQFNVEMSFLFIVVLFFNLHHKVTPRPGTQVSHKNENTLTAEHLSLPISRCSHQQPNYFIKINDIGICKTKQNIKKKIIYANTNAMLPKKPHFTHFPADFDALIAPSMFPAL